MKNILLIIAIVLTSCATPKPHYIVVAHAKVLRKTTLIRGVKSHTYVYPCTCVKVGDTVRVYSNWLLMPKF
jgi:hypothetical protein